MTVIGRPLHHSFAHQFVSPQLKRERLTRVKDARQDVVPTNDVVIPTPVIVPSTNAIDMVIVRRRYLDE